MGEMKGDKRKGGDRKGGERREEVREGGGVVRRGVRDRERFGDVH